MTYLVNVFGALSILAYSLAGGEYGKGLSTPVGRSIKAGGVWSKVWMPARVRAHFEDAA